MSERERWIVYPLLFLALGAALRDKLLKQTRTDEIVCQQLTIVDEDMQKIAVLGRASNTGSMMEIGAVNAQVYLQNGKPMGAQQGGGSIAVPDVLNALLRAGIIVPQPSAGSAQGEAPPKAGQAETPAPGPPAGKEDDPARSQ